MNLMGPVGQGYFVFALNSSKQGGTGSGALVDLALSTIPFEYAEQVRQLGKNHHHHSIDFDQLYFATQPSPKLGIPVPHFALAVRELRVEQTHCLGSHTFFIARILHRHVYLTPRNSIVSTGSMRLTAESQASAASKTVPNRAYSPLMCRC